MCPDDPSLWFLTVQLSIRCRFCTDSTDSAVWENVCSSPVHVRRPHQRRHVETSGQTDRQPKAASESSNIGLFPTSLLSPARSVTLREQQRTWSDTADGRRLKGAEMFCWCRIRHLLSDGASGSISHPLGAVKLFGPQRLS